MLLRADLNSQSSAPRAILGAFRVPTSSRQKSIESRVSLFKLARRSDDRISLGTSAHHATELGFIELGLAAALLAKIPADRILNFLPLADLKRWMADIRESRIS